METGVVVKIVYFRHIIDFGQNIDAMTSKMADKLHTESLGVKQFSVNLTELSHSYVICRIYCDIN
jgi:hypothetical protein